MDTRVDQVAVMNITFCSIRIYMKCEMTLEVRDWNVVGSACCLGLSH
jgi:hypothetical protein